MGVSIYTVYHNLRTLLVSGGPLFLLFAAHECASVGCFLSSNLRCNTAGYNTPMSSAWPHLWLVLYYYALCKYSILIESHGSCIKA